jgi:hypothetical protein
MFRLILVLATVLIATTAEAQKVYRLPAGDYLITGDVRPIGPVIVPGTVVPPPVDPIVPPPVVPVATLTKAVTDAVNAIPASDKRHTAAVKVSAVYQMIGSKVEDDTLPFASAGAAVAYMMKPALGVSDAATWAGVSAIVEAKLNGCQSKADCLTTLNTAASAVLATVPASESAVASLEPGVMRADSEVMQSLAKTYGIDWNAFLMILLELFLKFLPMIISAVEKVGFLILFA